MNKQTLINLFQAVATVVILAGIGVMLALDV
jgi:hypothetical protein